MEIRGDLYKNGERNLYKLIRMWLIMRKLRGDLYKNSDRNLYKLIRM